eukprot:SAG11_NODE_23298_length_391_cov_1.037671_1_plen_44_part_10
MRLFATRHISSKFLLSVTCKVTFKTNVNLVEGKGRARGGGGGGG